LVREYSLVFVRSPTDLTVTEGEDASFECQLVTQAPPATDDVFPSDPPPVSPPVPVVRWYKDEDLIPADDGDFKQTFDWQTGVACLYIAGTYLDDAAVYCCSATAAADDDADHDTKPRTASVTATLTVNGILCGRSPSY